MLKFFYQCIVTNIDSAVWNRDSFYPSSATTGALDNITHQSQPQYQQPVEYGQSEYDRRDSRLQSHSNSRAGSRSNSRPSSRPMSRASSQQRFYDEGSEFQQQRSLSRNDSQRSITEYPSQRPTETLITTRIEESYVEPTIESVRKPSVTFKNDEYEQEPKNIQPMAEQRNPLFTPTLQSQQFEEQSSSYQPSEYDYGQQQNMGFTSSTGYDPQKYEQPIIEQPYYQPESQRESLEEKYRSYIEPQEPNRSSPPKTPTRELSREEINKNVQQRQQSRELLYEREETQENISETTIRTSPPASLISSVSTTASSPSSIKPPLTANGKQVAPPSPKRTIPTNPRNTGKGGTEQKNGRNTMGEATGTGRKSDNVQKQSPKVSNIRGKK